MSVGTPLHPLRASVVLGSESEPVMTETLCVSPSLPHVSLDTVFETVTLWLSHIALMLGCVFYFICRPLFLSYYVVVNLQTVKFVVELDAFSRLSVSESKVTEDHFKSPCDSSSAGSFWL